MSILEIENEIIEDFELFENNWEGKYEYLIDLGKSLPLIPEGEKTDAQLIKGCQSQLWLKSELVDGKIVYQADSDAIMTKGMAAIMVRVLSNHTPQEIVAANLDFINKIGLKEHLSPTRANGLVSLIKQMKLDAFSLSEKV